MKRLSLSTCLSLVLFIVACGGSVQSDREMVEYQSGIEARLDGFESRLDEMRARVDVQPLQPDSLATGSPDSLLTNGELKRQIARLENMTRDAEMKLTELKLAGKEQWQELKVELDRALRDLEQAFNDVEQTAQKY